MATTNENEMSCTCARLRRLTRRVTQIYDDHLEGTGLSIGQFGLLAPLNTHGSIPMGLFAERAVMDPTTLTRNLAPMQRDGYVKIEADPEDRRRRIVSITAKGRRVFQDAVPSWRKAQEQLTQALGKSNTAALNASLLDTLEQLTQ